VPEYSRKKRVEKTTKLSMNLKRKDPAQKGERGTVSTVTQQNLRKAEKYSTIL
jgi:hypothetical protein